MPKKKQTQTKISATASAKLEAVAKASYQRKKIITETIPADVSRAKAGAWLTLLSPITEWAGLKGDALRFQRQQLRIQQEEALFAIAQSVRRKIAGQATIEPVPRKILVPALEKASLEDADDDVMVELWANLLASASSGEKIEPRYVGIIGELSGSQAKSLSALVLYGSDRTKSPYSSLI